MYIGIIMATFQEVGKRKSRSYYKKKKSNKPGHSFVHVGPKPPGLPKLADLPFRSTGAVGGLLRYMSLSACVSSTYLTGCRKIRSHVVCS